MPSSSLEERVRNLERRLIVPGGSPGDILTRRFGRAYGAAWESPVLDADLTQSDLVNSATESSLYSFTIPANTLGATGGFRLTAGGDFLNNTGVDRSMYIKVNLGATAAFTSNSFSIGTSTNRRKWYFTFLCMNSATNAQKWMALFHLSAAGTNDLVVQSTGSQTRSTGAGYNPSAEDTLTGLLLDFRAKLSLADASLSMRKEIAVLERMGP